MRLARLIFLLPGVLFLFGCASHSVTRAPDLDHDLRAQQEQLETNGVYLMARPVHQEEDLKLYFDDDLIKLGILPVQINITNKDGDRNYNFQADSIVLYDPEGGRHSSMRLEQVLDKTKKSYWRSAGWGVALGVIGAGVSAANVAHVNNKMRTSYNESILKSGNLNQGNTVEGFVYFSVPQELDSLDGWKIEMLLADLAGGENLAFNYALAGTVLVRKSPDTEDDSEEN